MKLKRKVLYPSSFLKSVPVPESWDRRPLPNLIHKAPNPENELTRLEKWYRCLRSGQKKDLKKRLRSLTYRDFWSAYAELMVSRIAQGLGVLSVCHSPRLWGKCPDLIVNFHKGGKQILEVAAAFQEKKRERDDEMAHQLASWMNRTFIHLWRVTVDATKFSDEIPFNKLRPIIQNWLKQLGHGGTRRLVVSPPYLNFELKLWANPPRQCRTPGPVVDGLMGQGGKLGSTDRIKAVIRKKTKKYREVLSAKLPLVVFLFEGDWIQISPFSLEGALWGQQNFNLSRTSGNSSLGVYEGGLFLPWTDGNPQNTRLSAVVYCRRVFYKNKVHATLNVYHNPKALHPVDLDCFKGFPQSQIKIRETEIEVTWDHERDTRSVSLG